MSGPKEMQRPALELVAEAIPCTIDDIAVGTVVRLLHACARQGVQVCVHANGVRVCADANKLTEELAGRLRELRPALLLLAQAYAAAERSEDEQRGFGDQLADDLPF